MKDRMAAEIGTNRSNFETNSVANRKSMQIRKDRCDCEKCNWYIPNLVSK